MQNSFKCLIEPALLLMEALNPPLTPYLIPIKNKVLDLSPQAMPVVMGILNLTPDSFSDGGRYTKLDAALHRAEQMLEEGATLLDLGGESSRPKGKTYGAGAQFLSADEEKRRILPVLEAILSRFPETLISIDTYKSEVAEAALAIGAAMLNDITALRFDPKLAEVAARFKVPLVLMHSIGTPGALAQVHTYQAVVEAVKSDLAVAAAQAKSAGVSYVLLDPGFGFGKLYHENLALLNHTHTFLSLGYPVLIGISRKSTIGMVLGSPDAPVPIEARLFGSLGATAVAVMQGASIVRTHDVKETASFLKVLHATRTA